MRIDSHVCWIASFIPGVSYVRTIAFSVPISKGHIFGGLGGCRVRHPTKFPCVLCPEVWQESAAPRRRTGYIDDNKMPVVILRDIKYWSNGEINVNLFRSPVRQITISGQETNSPVVTRLVFADLVGHTKANLDTISIGLNGLVQVMLWLVLKIFARIPRRPKQLCEHETVYQTNLVLLAGNIT